MTNWRKYSNEVITAVIRENPGRTPGELEKLIRAAYPFGERKYHPYKVWLSAVKLAMRELKGEPPKPPKQKKEKPDGQMSLFEEADGGRNK